jgi:Na+/H+-dicarboxylate symporter
MRLALHYQILIAMVIGAGVGLPLNIYAGPRERLRIGEGQAAALDAGQVTAEARAAFDANDVPLASDAAVAVERAGAAWHVTSGDETHVLQKHGAEIVVFSGGDWPRTVAKYGKRLGDLFLRLLSMIVAPLIFTSLVTGVTSTGNLQGLGRLGGRTLVFYFATSAAAVCVGVLLSNMIQPGKHANLDLIQRSAEAVTGGVMSSESTLGEIIWDQVFTLVPSNPFAAISDPGNTSMLGVIFFALLFGVFITVVGGEQGRTLTRFFSAGFDVMMRMTMFIICFAPLGVLGYMLYASAGKGLEVFAALGLTIHSCVTVPLILLLLARRSPWAYFKAMSPALLTAFSTASSNGTLPLTISCVEKRAGISNRICSFVLPLGATINMDGTALYEVAAVLFIAQVTGHDLSVSQQLIVALTALLASVGAAGIPHAGTVMMVVVLGAVNLPLEGVGLILAVDRILDMYRTSVNVWGDMTACAVVARLEGEPVREPVGESAAEPA